MLLLYRNIMLHRVIVEHARGTPRGEDLRRDLDRGYSMPSRRRGGGGSSRDRFVCSILLFLFLLLLLMVVVVES